jgi:hypothetical protein
MGLCGHQDHGELPTSDMDRRIRDISDDYEDDDECGYDEPAIDEKDDLLDMGIKKPISLLAAQRDHVGEQSRERMRKQAVFLEECMRWYKDGHWAVELA